MQNIRFSLKVYDCQAAGNHKPAPNLNTFPKSYIVADWRHERDLYTTDGGDETTWNFIRRRHNVGASNRFKS